MNPEIRTELQVTVPYPTRDEAQGDLFTNIVCCDRHRRHTFLRCMSLDTREQPILPELIAEGSLSSHRPKS